MGSSRRKLYRPHLGNPRSSSSALRESIPPDVTATRLARFVEDGMETRAPDDTTIASALEFARAGANRMSALLFARSSSETIAELATAWDLHPLLVEDLTKGRQRPKLERYHDVTFIVARSAWYVDATEQVEFAEFHILIRPDAVVILCQDDRWVDGADMTDLNSPEVSSRTHVVGALLSDTDLLKMGPGAVAYTLLDIIVDGYIPVLEGLDVDKDQIERQVFSGDAAAAERIYRLSQEVIDLKQASSSLTSVVASLATESQRYGISEHLQTYFADLSDHLTRINIEVIELRDSLTRILAVNATLVGQRQNEDMKTISGWAAILFAPALIAAIFGMNFVNMPGLDTKYGYPITLGLMVVLTLIMRWIFKLKKWM